MIKGYNKLISIDCGFNGAIVVKDEDLKAYKIPRDFPEINTLIESLRSPFKNDLVFIEHQQLRKTDFRGGRFHNIEKLVLHYRMLLDSLWINDFSVVSVHPKTWISYYQIKGQTYKDRKNKLKLKAKELFKDEKVTAWNQDAFLILRFAEHQIETNKQWILNNLNDNRYQNLTF
jgi:hypothetical protein